MKVSHCGHLPSVHGNWCKTGFTQEIHPLTIKLGQWLWVTQGFKVMTEAIN